MHTVSAFISAPLLNAVAGIDASLTAKGSSCLFQPVEPPPAAVVDTNRITHIALHTPSDPAAAASDIAASRMTHPTEPEGDSTIVDTNTDQSTHGSAKAPMSTSVESKNAAGFVAWDNAAAGKPAQSTAQEEADGVRQAEDTTGQGQELSNCSATATNPVPPAYTDAVQHHHVTGAATDTILSVTKPNAASQPSAGATVPCVVPGSVAEARVASYTAEPCMDKALSDAPAGTVADSKGAAIADAQAKPLVEGKAAPETEALAQSTADDKLGQVPDAIQGSREHAEAVPEAGTRAAAAAATAQSDMEAAAAHLSPSAASKITSVPTSNLSKAAAVAAPHEAAESEASQPVSSLDAQLPDARSAEARASLPALPATAKVFKPPAGWTAIAEGAARSRRRSATSTAAEAKAGRAVDSLQQGPPMGSSDAVAVTAEAVPTAVATSTSRQTCGHRTAKAPATGPATAPVTAPATAAAPTAGGGKDLVGRRIEIWWSKDKEFYPGVLKSYNHRKVTAAM